MVRTPPTERESWLMDRHLGPGYGEFRTDYEPILGRIARSQSHSHSGGGARTAIVDHGNPGAWHGASATAPATTVACTSDAEVLEGVLDSVDSHEFVFARLMALADALGCTCCHRFSGAYSILTSLRGHAQSRYRWRRSRKPRNLSKQRYPIRESKPCPIIASDGSVTRSEPER